MSNHKIQFMKVIHVPAMLMLAVVSINAQANVCYDLAAQRYNVSPALLRAIAQQESGERGAVVNINANGSRDIGLMQINSSWLPLLSRYGISEHDLLDPCVSALVGAWILSGNLHRIGYNTQGLGAYNALSPAKRERYSKKILHRLSAMTNNTP
jgi:soluble lytic murein transglycosylase-like protein